MLLLLMLLNTSNSGFALGIGLYPNGFVSFKFNANTPTVFQLTVGTATYYSYNEHGYSWGNDFAVGGRALVSISKGGSNSVQYTHFLGGGAGIHGSGDIVFVGEGFYEFELFPNPAELPISFEIGVVLMLVPQWESHIIGIRIPLGIHFYL